ncbi:hypothetical protein ACFX5F_05360 [Flavobacterium sp. ZS1P70]|uniref:Class I SAM-dependent methyltransferase n=1 Tax=Flavobacterium zhoui TaxID=3230414 RepID=A0ABW6I4E8_9FLAO
MDTNRRNHWDIVYEKKLPNEVSWTQENPKTSVDFIRENNLDKSAKIIDIGGGDSRLIDYLLEEGYENLTVLDISSKALERAKTRLGNKVTKLLGSFQISLNLYPIAITIFGMTGQHFTF